MSEKANQSSREKCLQSLIHEEWKLTACSFAIVLAWLFYWDFCIHLGMVFPPTIPARLNIENLINTGMQKQLFWAVVALSSFIGFFQFLEAITKRKSFSWLYKSIFKGFTFTTTFSVTRIADQYKWVFGWERLGNVPIESPCVHEFILKLLPAIVPLFCLLLWFVYLCLFVERITRKDFPAKKVNRSVSLSG